VTHSWRGYRAYGTRRGHRRRVTSDGSTTVGPGRSADRAAERVDLVPAELGPGIYPLLNSIVLPRPIAWVSTRSHDGHDNVAPHSYFTVASVAPPVVCFTSVGEKDTLRNIRETGEFVVNVTSRSLLQQVNGSSTNFPPERSEFDDVGLTRQPSELVTPSRVAESPVAIECRLAGERSFGASTVVFGEVLHIAVSPEVMRDGEVRPELLDPIARLGGSLYSALGDLIEVDRIRFSGWEAGRR